MSQHGAIAQNNLDSPLFHILTHNPIRPDSATYFVLTGRSHGESGRFAAHSLPGELRSAEMG